MKAKYSGTCKQCGRQYPVGTEIARGPRGWVCCGGAPAARPTAPSRPAQPDFRVLVAGGQLQVSTAWAWPPREAVTAAIKSVQGRRWKPQLKAWQLPLEQGARLAALVSQAAPLLTKAILEAEGVAEASAAHEATLAASRAASAADEQAARELPCRAGLAYLPFQQAGILYGIEHDNVLIGDEMGLGKTVQALGIANATGARTVLVVCPASLRTNWSREAARWLVGERTIAIANGKVLPEADVVIVNYERVGRLRAQIDERSWDLLVLDEAHYLKNPKSQRTKAVLGYWDAKAKAAVAGLRATRRVVLTGTPIPNRPVELWPIVQALDPDGLGRNWKGFVTRYCDGRRETVGRGRFAKTVWNVSGASNLAELQERLRAACMVRRRKADVLKELPPKRRQIVVLPPNGATGAVRAEHARLAAQETRRIAAQVAAELAKAAEDDAAYETAVRELSGLGQVDFTEMSDMRHDTALDKAPMVVEYVTDMLEGGGIDKIVVMCHHKDVLAELAAGLAPYGVATLSGDDSMEARQTAVDAFQGRDDVRVFVGTIAAAGVGLTLTAASTVVFAELDWVPGNMSQAEDRCHRIGQTDPVLVLHLVLDGSLDAQLAQTLVDKQDVIDRALDREADRATESERLAETAGELGEVASAAFAEARRAERDQSWATKSAKRDELAVEAAGMTDEQVTAIHEALRRVASYCDGARKLDGCGFSKIDTGIGHSLAAQPRLTPRQAALGLRLVRKYRRQLESALLEACGVAAKGGK